MVCGITKQMHQRISDLIYHSSVKLGLFTGHDQLHFLIQLLVQIADHLREFLYDSLDRNHSYLHNRFMQVCCHAFQIFDLLIKCIVCQNAFLG